MYNVFISYRREGGYELARLVYEHLTSKGFHPFFDLEELSSGQLNHKLYDTIEECDNFILILNANCLDKCHNESDWVRLEIKHAIEKKKNIIPFMMGDFSWPKEPIKGLEELSNYNGVLASREYFGASIDKLSSMFKKDENVDKELENKKPIKTNRLSNKYFSADDKKEVKRLKIQQKLLEQFDKPIYNKILSSLSDINVLDVGSNNGDFIMDRIGYQFDIKTLVGLEYDQKAVALANEKYGQDNKIGFFLSNVEDDTLETELEEIMDKMNIDSFDIIIISMVLLHLKNPYKLLKTVRKVLKPGGYIIIKDIDDGFNVAYPDENEYFQRAIDICNKNETAGYRHSGRQIYTFLKRSGYKNVCLEKSGLSTIGMDFDERAALFHTYFSFITEDLKIMNQRYPNNKQILEDLNWYEEVYEDLELSFQEDSFYFNLGFVLFTAQR